LLGVSVHEADEKQAERKTSETSQYDARYLRIVSHKMSRCDLKWASEGSAAMAISSFHRELKRAALGYAS
jgi:hypothetical protein